MQATDIMIHFDQVLNPQQQTDIEQQLRKQQGVIAPRFNKNNLLVVYYNLEKTNTKALNNFVQSLGHNTQLVGM